MKSFQATRWTLAALGLALFSAGIFFAGCTWDASPGAGGGSSAAPISLGEPVKAGALTVCTGCLQNEKVGRIVTVEGEIIQQCPARGCWFRLKDDVGEAFVDLAPAKLRLAENRVGQHAKVTGKVVKVGGKSRLQAQYVELSPGKTGGSDDGE